MFLLNMLNNKLKLPPRENALPGRASALPTASHHFVNGTALHAPFPQGMETAMFGLGCFWGAERKFWQIRRASIPPPWAMPPGSRPTRPIRKSAPG